MDIGDKGLDTPGLRYLLSFTWSNILYVNEGSVKKDDNSLAFVSPSYLFSLNCTKAGEIASQSLVLLIGHVGIPEGLVVML